MSKPKFKVGDKVYFVWHRRRRTGVFHSYHHNDPELAVVDVGPAHALLLAAELLHKTREASDRAYARRLINEGAKTYERLAREEFKRAMGIRKRAKKFDLRVELEPRWLAGLRSSVQDGPIGTTAMVGHKELAEALAFIESTLGVKEPRRKPVPEERYS